MSHEFKVGDRFKCSYEGLVESVRGREGVVTKIVQGQVWGRTDDSYNPTDDGWSFNPEHITLIEGEPTDEEIAALFNVKIEPCTHCGCASGGIH